MSLIETSGQPPRRTPFISGVNAAIATARWTGVVRRAVLEKDALLQQARDLTGLDNFGDLWFEQPLDVLLDALRGEARLNPAGEWVAAKQCVKMLVDRLWAENWFARHPEILDRPLPHPVVIIGPMRSGTTWLHRLLATDPRFAHLRSFETVSPVPRPGFRPGDPDPRIALQKRIMLAARLANPRTLAIHPTGPFEPEEELGLLCNSFYGSKHEVQWWVPSYGRWSEACDATPAYAQMARLLRLVAWSQQASSLKPWLLKTPQHLLDLPVLLGLFPDARLIFTHRDPLAVVGSAASLAWNQTMIYSDRADPAQIGRESLHKIGLMIERGHAARPLLPPSRVIDIHYAEMEADWEAPVRRVYAFLGLDIEPALPGMRAYNARFAAQRRKPHRYSLTQFGLSSRQVLDALGDYMRTYDVVVERRATVA